MAATPLKKAPPPPEDNRPTTKSYAAAASATGSTKSTLPDFGIIGTCKGEPALFVSRAELEILARPFENALVARFPDYRPRIDEIRKFFTRLDLKAECKIGLLDAKNVLVHPSCLEDYNRLFSRREWYIGSNCFVFSKWTVDFRCNEDCSTVPIWFELPGLPLPFFNPLYVAKIGKLIGRPLQTDAATSDLRRPSVARVLVEVDIQKPRCTRVWLGEDVIKGRWQEIHAETWPEYCEFCKRIGHSETTCRKKNPPPETERKPPNNTGGPKPPNRKGDNNTGSSRPHQVYQVKQTRNPSTSAGNGTETSNVPSTSTAALTSTAPPSSKTNQNSFQVLQEPDAKKDLEQQHSHTTDEHMTKSAQPIVVEEPSAGSEGAKKKTTTLDPSAKSFEYPKSKAQPQMEKGQQSAPFSMNTWNGARISPDSLRAFHSTLQARFDASGVIPDPPIAFTPEKESRTPTYLESAMKHGGSDPDTAHQKKNRSSRKDKAPSKRRSRQHDKFACSSDVDKIIDQLDASDKEPNQQSNSFFENFDEWTTASEIEDFSTTVPFKKVATRERKHNYRKYYEDYEYY